MNKKVNNFVIYDNVDPNQEYSLLYIGYGPSFGFNGIGDELITDGEIKRMDHSYSEEPCGKDDLYRRGSLDVELKDASFAILRHISDNVPVKSNIYTNLDSEEDIKKIISIADVDYVNNELLVTKEPYVRKITLK